MRLLHVVQKVIAHTFVMRIIESPFRTNSQTSSGSGGQATGRREAEEDGISEPRRVAIDLQWHLQHYVSNRVKVHDIGP